MKTKLILSLVLVLSGGLVGCSAIAQNMFTAEQDAGVKQHFENYLNQCGTNEVRCLWFLQNNLRVGMVMTINLDKQTVATVRDVYNWAEQGGHTQKLSDSQVFILKKIINDLPLSNTNDFNISVFVSIRPVGSDKVKVYQYDRNHAPDVIQRIYDIGGGYFYGGKD